MPVLPSGLGFAAPYRLLLLLAVAGLLVAYLWQHRRRPRFAARFTELDLLASVAPRSAAWRRHVPAALLLVALTALTVAFAQPLADTKVPRERATIVVALDTSASMMATDVTPDRLAAAQAAARAFVAGLPARFNVGLVSFSGSASVVVAPTQDHAAVRAAIAGLQLGGGTAIGEAVFTALQAITTVPGSATAGPPPARIVLLSDGGNTVGRPVAAAAAAAAAAHVPVSTIAYGTPDGTVVIQGQLIPVPVDGPALQRLALATGGTSYRAQSGSQLASVYSDIGSQVGYVTRRREITATVVGIGLLAAAASAVTSLLWTARFP